MKVWKASLALNVSQDRSNEDRYQTYFEVVECKEDFKFSEERKEFFHSEGRIRDRVSSVMREEAGTYDVVKIVQGFAKEPAEEEKNEIEMQMKLYMIEVLEARREEYLSNLDDQLWVIGETVKYRYEVTGTTNVGKKFRGKCVAYSCLDSMSELFHVEGLSPREILSREIASANSEIKIEEIVVLDEI